MANTIDLDSVMSPAILAGILGISVGMVYQGIQDGKLPSRPNPTYRDCIHHYLGYYKKKVTSRSTSMGEAKLAQDIRNGIAKEYLQWMEIKKMKEEVLDLEVVKELFEPIFQLLRSSLVNISRQYPETTSIVDTTLESLYAMGYRLEKLAKAEAAHYVQSMLDKEVSLAQATEDAEDLIGDTSDNTI